MRLTFHGTLLGVILILLAMMAIGPARQLYDEQQTVRADQATLAAGRAEANQLATRLQELKDPNFIEQLARQQLGYVAPGETSYVVPRSGGATAPTLAPARQDKAHAASWLQRLWDGIA